jgi:hypothetical protein
MQRCNGAQHPHALQKKLFDPRSAHYAPRSARQRIHQDRNSPTTTTNRPANVHGGNKNITIFHHFYGAPSRQDRRLQSKRNKIDNRPINHSRPELTSDLNYFLSAHAHGRVTGGLVKPTK